MNTPGVSLLGAREIRVAALWIFEGVGIAEALLAADSVEVAEDAPIPENARNVRIEEDTRRIAIKSD